ncbi:hypothetical protein IFM89_014870 [Coptis chinensis]|uniref:Uncharacterized protein n=1 Tax=Coptis chinensis TaxID=261450 RepID=A0A835I9P5_9MAGN|nr:hypothetical protein IFM89_014870 [Coptis chinensis]
MYDGKQAKEGFVRLQTRTAILEAYHKSATQQARSEVKEIQCYAPSGNVIKISKDGAVQGILVLQDQELLSGTMEVNSCWLCLKE